MYSSSSQHPFSAEVSASSSSSFPNRIKIPSAPPMNPDSTFSVLSKLSQLTYLKFSYNDEHEDVPLHRAVMLSNFHQKIVTEVERAMLNRWAGGVDDWLDAITGNDEENLRGAELKEECDREESSVTVEEVGDDDDEDADDDQTPDEEDSSSDGSAENTYHSTSSLSSLVSPISTNIYPPSPPPISPTSSASSTSSLPPLSPSSPSDVFFVYQYGDTKHDEWIENVGPHVGESDSDEDVGGALRLFL